MADWQAQLSDLIEPALARSKATDVVRIGTGTLGDAGALVSQVTSQRKALVMADSAGFAAAGCPVIDALSAAGFAVQSLVLEADPLPKASIQEAEPFRAALAADPDLFPVSVGSGVINDLVKYAAFVTDRRYFSVATAASMDGYTSAGAPLARDGFKITIPTRAPIALLADLDILADAPAEMNGWGYGDLAGKIPAGGDWMLADALGLEPLDEMAWPLVQDHLRGWLDAPSAIASADRGSIAGLFIGLTAVGFAMEFHGTSRPASGADHQIAHMWEMEGHSHNGRKVSHGAAVAVGCVATLALYDWLLQQNLSRLDVAATVSGAPDLEARKRQLRMVIADPQVAEKAEAELTAKHAAPPVHQQRLERLSEAWPDLRERLAQHLVPAGEMAQMLAAAGAPSHAHEIGVAPDHLMRTMNAAGFIRSRYTVLDLLHETGLTRAAFEAVLPGLCPITTRAAE